MSSAPAAPKPIKGEGGSSAVHFFFYLLLVASWQLCASARAMSVDKTSIDGLDCITTDYPPSPWTGAVVASTEEEPLQVCDDSSDPMQNSDLSESEWADKASIPSRSDQDSPHFPSSNFDRDILRSLGITPLLLSPSHSFYCLHEHIRERAPPNLA